MPPFAQLVGAKHDGGNLSRIQLSLITTPSPKQPMSPRHHRSGRVKHKVPSSSPGVRAAPHNLYPS